MFGRFGSLHSHHQPSSLHAAASVNKYGRRLLGEMLGSEGAVSGQAISTKLPDDLEMPEHELEAQLRDPYERAQGGKDDDFWRSIGALATELLGSIQQIRWAACTRLYSCPLLTKLRQRIVRSKKHLRLIPIA